MTRNSLIASIAIGVAAAAVVGGTVALQNTPAEPREPTVPAQPSAPENPKAAEPAVPGAPVIVSSPQPGQLVTSPLTVRGQARGWWYFEADFPVRLLDGQGKELTVAIAQAKGEWMTENYVPFEATLTFEVPNGGEGTLVFEKDNPSGLIENADEVRVPIRFAEKKAQTPPAPPSGDQKPLPGSDGVGAQAACRPTGCSGQVCSDEDVITTCEFRSEYACFKSGRCERQADGKCGWTQTPALMQCIEKARTALPLAE